MIMPGSGVFCLIYIIYIYINMIVIEVIVEAAWEKLSELIYLVSTLI